MKVVKSVPIFLSFFCISFWLHAQDKKDEQGLDISNSLQLVQDKKAVTEAQESWWSTTQENLDQRMDWFETARFGCFVHWGVYSVPAGIWHGQKVMGYSEHLMRKERIPLNTYKNELVIPFNPTEFDADEWMQQVKNAGMKYFIITAKHHDGFAMFLSKSYPYDMHLTQYGKDPMMALRNAALKYGIKFGFYYSHAFDWENPDAPGNDWDYPNNPDGDRLIGGKYWWLSRPGFLDTADKYVTQKSIPQIQELITIYHPDILWFDTPEKLPLFENLKILKAIRELDPENKIVINGRIARYANKNFGDYINTGDRSAFFHPVNGYWESIPTTNDSYGYSKVDTAHKSISYFIRLLSSAASKGGNILMNVGPMGNGKWDPKDIDLFNGVGNWLKTYGEAIYGTSKSDLPIQTWGVTTLKKDTLYAHVFNWPKNGKLTIGGLTSTIASARIMGLEGFLSFKKLGNKDVELGLPSNVSDTTNTVIAIVLKDKKTPDAYRLLNSKGNNTLYTFDAELQGGLDYGDGKPNRNYISNWKNNNQTIQWKLRVNQDANYNIYLDYNTQTASDTGSIIVEIGQHKFQLAYSPNPETEGVKRIFVGKIQLKANEKFICRLKGLSHNGAQFMRPIAVELTEP